MSDVSNIQLLGRQAIDDERWNNCINAAANGLAYAKTEYLDAMCTNWCALVAKDYKAVMPLPWRRKWGIKYVYTPFFLPALNIFQNPDTAIVDSESFLETLSQHFHYCHLDVDVPPLKDLPPHWRQSQRVNQVVPPGTAKFSRLVRRKLALAQAANLIIATDAAPQELIEAYKKTYSHQHQIIPKEAYQNLLAACCHAAPGSVVTLAAHLPHQPLAAFYLLLSDQRYVYSLLGGSTAAGKEAGAFYAVTHAAVQMAMNERKTFRFEGSDIPGIAFFNQQFGAVPQPYTQLHLNTLQWPLRWLKK